MIRHTLQSGLSGIFLTVSTFAAFVAAGSAHANEKNDDRLQFDGLLELRTIESEIDFDQGDGIDSSGIGGRARLGVDYELSDRTKFRAEAEGRVFAFRDDNRDTLETAIGRAYVAHELSDSVEVRLYANRYENISVLEARQADQTSAGARIQWESDNDRFRLTAEYRERQYDTTTPAEGDGYRLSAQYNKRLGSYHWLRFDLRHEEMRSDDAPQRSYDRQVARVRYSKPIAKRLRVIPSLEYRQWKYDSRIARGDPQGDLRKDSYVAPAIGLSWGRSNRGLYASASAEYRLRRSNDTRFENDAIRLALRVGYRF